MSKLVSINKSIESPTGQEFKHIINIKKKLTKELYTKYLEDVIKIQINTINSLLNIKTNI